MTAYNVVRFRVKPGFEEQFVEAHRKAIAPFKGLIGADLVKTGDRTYCFVGRWNAYQNIVDARSQMISILDTVRGMLEELGEGLGVTDPVSGSTVLRVGPPEAGKRRAAKKAKPRAKPKARAKAAKSKARKPAKAKARKAPARKKRR
jgi:hypothetical protein